MGFVEGLDQALEIGVRGDFLEGDLELELPLLIQVAGVDKAVAQTLLQIQDSETRGAQAKIGRLQKTKRLFLRIRTTDVGGNRRGCDRGVD